MKNIIKTIGLTALLFLIACEKKEMIVMPDNSHSIESKLSPSVEIKSNGKSSNENLIAKETAYGPRAGHTSLVFDDKMWVIGGAYKSSYYNDVWFSDNGFKWTASTSQAHFQGRYDHASAVFNNKMWVVGGRTDLSSPSATNDVWSSEDGIEWTEVTGNAAFPPRFYHTLTAFNGSLWLIGGRAEDTYSDIWRSYNGKNWFLVTEDAPFGWRRDHAAVEFDGKLWVIGGQANYPQIIADDVWYTSDGYDWIEATPDAAFLQRFGHTLTTDGNRLLLSGGKQAFNDFLPLDPHLNDVWSSSDGVNWEQINTPIELSARSQHSSVFYDDRLWILNGHGFSSVEKKPVEWISFSDVWSFEIPSEFKIKLE